MRLGLDDLQARFAAQVMHLGGVFLPSQVTVWLSHYKPGFSLDAPADEQHAVRERFLQGLLHEQPEIARTLTLASLDQRYYRMDSPYYSLVGLPDPRHSQITDTDVLRRLHVCDYVVRHPDLTWYGAQHQKRDLLESLGIPRHCWPMRKTPSTRHMPPKFDYFFDRQAIGLNNWQLVFPFACVEDESPGTLGSIIQSHKRLFERLRRLGFAVSLIVCHKRGAQLPVLRDSEVLPPRRSDREALANSVFLHLLELATEFDDAEIIAAQGGADAVRRLCREIRDARKRTPSVDSRVMQIRLHECQELPAGARGA